MKRLLTPPSIPKVIMMLLAINIIGVMLTISIINFNFSQIHSVNENLAAVVKKGDVSLNNTLVNEDRISDKLNQNFKTIVSAGENRTSHLYKILQNITQQVEGTQNADDKILTEILSANNANNVTLTKAGGFQKLLDDIEQNRITSAQNHDLLTKLQTSNVSVKILLGKLANKTR